MNIKAFKPVYPKVDLVTSPKSFFASIKYQYREYRHSGVYSVGEEAGLYIYQIKSAIGNHVGLLCSTDVDDLFNGAILKHEQTLAAKEQQMMHLIMKREALVKPVLLGYHPVDDIHDFFKTITQTEKPLVHVKFKEAQEEHLIFPVYDKKVIERIKASFKTLQTAYIGDGHHRSSTIALLSQSKDLGAEAKKYSRVLTAYFPFEDLTIYDFNRVVDIGEIMMSSQFVARMAKYFKIKELKSARKPRIKHEITMLIDDVWYSLKWKKKYLQKDETGVVLDSALINYYVFEKILGIEDVRTDKRIKYYGGTEPVEKIIRQTHKYQTGVGLCIYPVSVDELTKIADQNKVLPPKSTWFEPRLRSGLMAKDL